MAARCDMNASILCSLIPSPCFLFQKRLQNQGCGNLIDDAAVLLPGMAGFIQDLVRFARG